MTLPIISGEFRVGTDPELRFTPSGVAICTLRAVAGSRKKVNDEWVDDKSCWLSFITFKQQAENMAESFKKGDEIVVTGKLQQNDWVTSEGNKRTSYEVVVDSIGMSAKWSTVSSVKAERASGNQSSQAASTQEDPWTTPQSDDPPF